MMPVRKPNEGAMSDLMTKKLALSQWLSRLLALLMLGSLVSLGSAATAGASEPNPDAGTEGVTQPAVEAVAPVSCFSPTPHQFTDVDTDDYYDQAVSWLLESGITGGVTADRYGPNVNVSRGQMAMFLWKNAGSPEPSQPHSFGDVAADAYY
ncbi:MAG: S-layer homology domain-containing protein, partial [Candidatus Microthrix parvicella]